MERGVSFAANGTRLKDVFNLNNDTMTTEQNEIKSAEWRKKNLSKNSSLADDISRFIQEQQKKEEEIFTTALRTMAEPPIKGEITKGKVRWRGIRIVQYNDGFKYTKWLEQRGKQISPKIVFTGTIGNGP